jgi:hypothetical protein
VRSRIISIRKIWKLIPTVVVNSQALVSFKKYMPRRGHIFFE